MLIQIISPQIHLGSGGMNLWIGVVGVKRWVALFLSLRERSAATNC